LEQELEPPKFVAKKQNYELGKKFQGFWVAWLLWVEFVVNGNGLVNSTRCKIYFKIENEEKLPKLDSFLKHART
jgi:hypothetical protein